MAVLDHKQILNRGFDKDNNLHRVTLGDALKAPPESDAITFEFPNATTEIVRFREGGTAGTILKSLQLIYTNAAKSTLVSVEVI